MLHMERNLVGRKAYRITLTYFKFNCKKVLVFIISKQVRDAWKCQIF